ncbi:YjcZ family sporulation protein [Bacillus sp. B15-48]|nr:YjcZ family sporulation protein [Bacillus sp. B15-48]MBM4764305.1 YjcZ family sporulation protein [Bacillus sp. B15-48]
MPYGYGYRGFCGDRRYGTGFVLILVLFILLIIVGSICCQPFL